jgi:hypothetical protein
MALLKFLNGKAPFFLSVLFDKNGFKREFILDILKFNEGQDFWFKGLMQSVFLVLKSLKANY